MTYSGIYEIVNVVNGKRYIGSAAKFRNRFAVHRHGLRAGTHHSQKLQRAWLKYGEAAFSFRVLLLCAPENLLLYEQILLDALAPEYNICRIAGSILGVRWSDEARAKVASTRSNDHFRGRRHSPETLALMSAAQRGNTATKGKKRNPQAVARTAAAHRGMQRSPETRTRIAQALKASWAKRQR